MIKYFYLYTTGILDSMNLNIKSNIWINNIRNSILRNIDDSFKIIIIHYDILSSNKFSLEDINNNIILSDLNATKVEHSQFINKYIDINEIRFPYLILDMAHIFNYDKISLLNMKAVYIGYCHEEQWLDCGLLNSFISNCNFIKVDYNGKVTTYIDKILALSEEDKKKYKYNEIYPQEFLYNIYNKCKDIISIDANNYIKEIILYVIIDFIMNNNEIILNIELLKESILLYIG